MPEITVLMPAYNAIKYIEEAVESILDQTYEDFEFLIIDDGSTDGTLEYLKQLKDTRIRLHAHTRNRGLVACLNAGLDRARGTYIARMDHDDISDSRRFEQQYRYMESHPEVGVLGTFMKLSHNGLLLKKPTTHEEICCWQLFYCCLGHPTVFMRRSILQRYKIRYDQNYLHAEDYEIWNRLSEVTRIENLPEHLFTYRTHDNQVSATYSEIQSRTAEKVRIQQFNRLGIVPTKEELAIHMQFIYYNIPVFSAEHYSKALAWANKLLSHNDKAKIFQQETLNTILSFCFTMSAANMR